MNSNIFSKGTDGRNETVEDILDEELSALVDARLRADLDAFLADSTEDDFIFDSPTSAAPTTLRARRPFRFLRSARATRFWAPCLCLLIAVGLATLYVKPEKPAPLSEESAGNALVGVSEISERNARESVWNDAWTFVNFENKKRGEDWNALLNVADVGARKLAKFDGSKFDSTFESLRAANPVEVGRDVSAFRQDRKDQLLNNVAEIDWGSDYGANLEELNAVVADSLTPLDCLSFIDPLICICNNVLLPSEGVR